MTKRESQCRIRERLNKKVNKKLRGITMVINSVMRSVMKKIEYEELNSTFKMPDGQDIVKSISKKLDNNTEDQKDKQEDEWIGEGDINDSDETNNDLHENSEILLKENVRAGEKIDKRRIKGNRKRGRYLNNEEIKDFNELFPKDIDWLSREQLAIILNVNVNTINKYIKQLKEINNGNQIRGFNLIPRQIGLKRNQIRVIFEWHCLIHKRGGRNAKDVIHKRMLEVYPLKSKN